MNDEAEQMQESQAHKVGGVDSREAVSKNNSTETPDGNLKVWFRRRRKWSFTQDQQRVWRRSSKLSFLGQWCLTRILINQGKGGTRQQLARPGKSSWGVGGMGGRTASCRFSIGQGCPILSKMEMKYDSGLEKEGHSKQDPIQGSSRRRTWKKAQPDVLPVIKGRLSTDKVHRTATRSRLQSKIAA